MSTERADKPERRLRVGDAPADAWHVAVLMLTALDAWDWAGLLRQLEAADAVGHIFDPTGYRALIHDPNTERNARLAQALVALLATARDTHPELFADRKGGAS